MPTPKGGRDQLKADSFEMGKRGEPNASIEKKWLQITSLTSKCMHPPSPSNTHTYRYFLHILSAYHRSKNYYVICQSIFIWCGGSLNFTISGLLYLIFTLLGLFVLHHLLHQTLIEWEIGRAILEGSIFLQLLVKLQLLYCITCFHNKNIIL